MKTKTISNRWEALLPRFYSKYVWLCLFFLFLMTISSDAQKVKQTNQSLLVTGSALADYYFPEVVGKSFDLNYEYRIWKNLFIRGGVFLSNSQTLKGDKNASYSLVHGRPENSYGDYFVGQSSRGMGQMESFILNRQLLQLSFTYRLGKRNQFIPEIGISAGSGYLASLGIVEVANSRPADTIMFARPRTAFIRAAINGYFVGFSYAFKLNKGYYLQPSLRFFDVPNRTGVYNLHGVVSLSGASLGISFRKDFIPKNKREAVKK